MPAIIINLTLYWCAIFERLHSERHLDTANHRSFRYRKYGNVDSVGRRSSAVIVGYDEAERERIAGNRGRGYNRRLRGGRIRQGGRGTGGL